MTEPRLEFCEEYGYPRVVADHLAAICDIVSEVVGDDLMSLILLGSTSRGEMTCCRSNGCFVPWSDYEFLGVVKARPRLHDVAVARHLTDLERSIGEKSPLFHIDCSFVTPGRMRKLPPIVRHFETKRTGRVLVGDEALHMLPEIDAENLDLRDVNEILLWRYWSMVLYLPKEALSHGLGDAGRRMYSYVLCRNALDITTFLLPHLGELIAGFADRQEWLESNASMVSRLEDIDQEMIEFLGRAASEKIDPKFQEPMEKLVSDAASAFAKARRFMIAKYSAEEHAGNGDMSAAPWRKIFKDNWTSKRKGFEALMLMRRALGLGRLDLGWWARPKHGLVFQALVHLFDSAAARIGGGQNRDEELLNRAGLTLAELIPGYRPDDAWSDEFAERWAGCRRWVARFMLAYFPSLSAKAGYLSRLVDGI